MYRKFSKNQQGGEGQRRGLAMPEEIDCNQQRDQQLAERPAQDADRVPKPTKKEMAALVDDQVDVVDQQETVSIGGCVQQEQRVEGHPAHQRRA